MKLYIQNQFNIYKRKNKNILNENCFNYSNHTFTILKQNNQNDKSRIGIIDTPRGYIETPNFLFCATKGCIKSTPLNFINNLNVQILLSNTFHLLIHPNPYTIYQLGGLHKFMNWNKPILTDSGGYQIFSMCHGSVSKEIKKTSKNNIENNNIVKLCENGAIYKSYFDGKIDILTPEISIQTQYLLGSDFILVLDECTPYHVDKQYTEKSMNRCHRWYIRCLLEYYKSQNINYHDYLNKLYNQKFNNNIVWGKREKNKQALYGIIQGGIYEDLRKESCNFVNELPFFGLCIGGCLGNNKKTMYNLIKFIMNYLSNKKSINKTIHLLGIGKVKDIFYGVKNGIDTFDCVIPSRLARHGYFLSKVENINKIEKKINKNIKNEYVKIKLNIFKLDKTPLEDDCDCYTCLNYSKAYLYHLYKINDNLLGTLLTIHNVNYMHKLMYDIRKGIKENSLHIIEKKWIK